MIWFPAAVQQSSIFSCLCALAAAGLPSTSCGTNTREAQEKSKYYRNDAAVITDSQTSWQSVLKYRRNKFALRGSEVNLLFNFEVELQKKKKPYSGGKNCKRLNTFYYISVAQTIVKLYFQAHLGCLFQNLYCPLVCFSLYFMACSPSHTVLLLHQPATLFLSFLKKEKCFVLRGDDMSAAPSFSGNTFT